MSRKPWFPFYAADWLSDARVTALTLPEQGAYVRLLAIQWREGHIPSCERTLNRLIGFGMVEHLCDLGGNLFDLKNVLAFFASDPTDSDVLRNKRLEEIRKEADDQRARLSESGRKGGRSKAKNRSSLARFSLKPNPTPALANTQSQSQSQSQSQEVLSTTPQSPPAPGFDFEAVYQSYPKKLGKKKGLERCRSRIKTPAKYEELVKAVANYSAHVSGKDPQFTKHFDSFLSVWEDWINAPEVVPFRSKPPVWREPMQAAAENKREVL